MTAQTITPTSQTTHRAGGIFTSGLILMLLGILAILIMFCGWVFLQRMERLYKGYIYPNVYALGVPLGGMSPNEAAATLAPIAEQVNTGILILTDGDARWSYAWSEAGMHIDTHATAQAAYALGRETDWREQVSIWLNYHDVAPRFTFDATAARGLLENLSQEVSRPPVEPGIKLENGEIVVVPGEAGRVLNVSSTLVKLQTIGGGLYRVEESLEFDIVPPPEVPNNVKTQAEALLSRHITLTTYDVLSDETFTWDLGREAIATWLHLLPGPEGDPTVEVNLYKIQDTLLALAEEMGGGRGFHFEQAAQQVFDAFEAGETTVTLYLSHPERTYAVEAGDTLTSLSAKFGMPPGLVAEANRDIDINRLSVGQKVTIPSQDILTPYLPTPGKKIVISLNEQHMRVYEQGTLIHEWLVSTGLPDSPTHRGVFQVIDKQEEAYASQWDLRMPYFITIYPAGGNVDNGIHELPILANGQRLWEGHLGRPASFGCIILGIPDAETLYQWADIGVLVVIE